MSDLMLEAGMNPLLLIDQRWQIQVALALTVLDVAAEGLFSLTPPPGAEPMHQDVVQVGETTQRIVNYVTHGLDNFDATAMDLASLEIETLAPVMARLNRSVEQFCD